MINDVSERLNELKGTEQISVTWRLNEHTTTSLDINLVSGVMLDLDARTAKIPCTDYVRHFDIDKAIVDFVVVKDDWRHTFDDMTSWLFKRFQLDVEDDINVTVDDLTKKNNVIVFNLTVDIDPYNEITSLLGKIFYTVDVKNKLVTSLHVMFSTLNLFKHDAMRRHLRRLDSVVSAAEWAGCVDGQVYPKDDFGFR